MSTNGRGHIMRAALVWSWQDAGAMQYLVRTAPYPEWVAVVPANMDRPGWIPQGRSCTRCRMGRRRMCGATKSRY